MSHSTSLALALVIAGLAAGAQAQDNAVVKVDVSRFDLRNPEDARSAYEQLSQTARQVCNAAGQEKIAFLETERFDRCYRATLDEAVAQSNANRLVWLNREAMIRQYGRPYPP
jgi:UrcA family protein